MFTNQAWQTIFNWTSAIADILVLWLILYYALKIVRNNSRTVQIFKGILLVLGVQLIAQIFNLTAVGALANQFVSWGFVVVIIIFQPEIRGMLERLGKSSFFSKITALSNVEKEHLVDEIVKAVIILSNDKTGALITIEQGQSLSDYIKTGTLLNSEVSTELLTSLFVTSTPLHDGAVIIQGDQIACASAYFPPTNIEVPNRYGARHRAAIGISEITDSVTIVVSEETGQVSIAEDGKLRTVDLTELREYLMKIICNEEIEVNQGKAKAPRQSVYVVDMSEGIETPTKVSETASKKTKKTAEVKKEREGLLSRFAPKKQPTRKSNEEVVQDLIAAEKNIKHPSKKKVKDETKVEPLEIKKPQSEVKTKVETEKIIKEDKVTPKAKPEPTVAKPRKIADIEDNFVSDEKIEAILNSDFAKSVTGQKPIVKPEKIEKEIIAEKDVIVDKPKGVVVDKPTRVSKPIIDTNDTSEIKVQHRTWNLPTDEDKPVKKEVDTSSVKFEFNYKKKKDDGGER